MNDTWARLGVVALIGVIGACGAREQHGADAADTERWELYRAATIGPETAGMTEAIRSIAVDRDGNVYAAGYGAGGIFAFDSAGRLLRVLGRAGSGPAEFEDRYSLAWVGDTLAVYDPGNGRIEFIDRQGNWVASQGNPRITGGSDIRFHQAGPRAFFRPSYDADDSKDGIRLLFIRAGLDVAPDTLIVPDVDLGGSYGITCRGNGISWWQSASAPEARQAVSPHGDLVTWRTDQYRLTFTSNDGRIVRIISANQPPIPLADSAWARDLEDYQKWRKDWSGADCDPGSPRRPETVWLLRAVEFDDQGRAWVEGMQHDTMTLAVYDSTGQQIASMPAPKRDLDVPYVIRGDRLYEVEADQDGVQLVAIYRIGQ